VRKSFVGLGLYVLIIGVSTSFLLGQLEKVTFRGSTTLWHEASFPLAGIGITIVVIGLFLGYSIHIFWNEAARYFTYAALSNALAAGLFILPIFVPQLEFPILITRWPGIYMVTAYFSFIIVGVLGNLAWGSLFSLAPRILFRERFDKGLVILQWVLMQVGVYGLAIFMFYGGYIGSELVNNGAQDTLVGISMESAVIPSALFIFTVLYSVLLGVANLFWSSTVTLPTDSQAGLQRHYAEASIR
jgi:hypothetical protein